MIDWHRTSMLPRYSIYLTDMADSIFTGQYSTNDVKKLIINGRSLYEETVTGMTPYAAKFLLRYQNPQSIEHMKQKMQKIFLKEKKLFCPSLDFLVYETVNSRFSHY